MKEIYALIDYKKQFGSKYNAVPYNSGFDKELLSEYFKQNQINLNYISFSDVMDFEKSFWFKKIVIYTSSEDTGYHYKSFIEDIVYYLELIGAHTIPSYKYLRANKNKVFMEMLRNTMIERKLCTMNTKVFGTYEELQKNISSLKYPIVFKNSAGAMSKGVGKANNPKELLQKIKRIIRTKNYFREVWELGRTFKHRGYTRESKHRGKFIVQEFIAGLNGDYKVLIFGDKFYVLKRDTKKDDFRASGSGIRIYTTSIPEGLLEYSNMCRKEIDMPNLSIDVAFINNKFHLIEFQCIFFGSYTITHSPFYWIKKNNDSFTLVNGESILEKEYCNSIVNYCNSKSLF